MSPQKQKIPPIVKLLAALVSLIAFAVGFWHAHLGLKEMRPFESDYGSLFIAAIILLVLLISYFFAVTGRKIALLFYLVCAMFFIVFNLNFFYPSYLGRQLVKEEATAVNDTLQHFANKYIAGLKTNEFNDYQNLENLQKQLIAEISLQIGFGPKARNLLEQFNTILGKYHVAKINEPSFAGIRTPQQQADIMNPLLEKAIENFLKSNINVKDVDEFLAGKDSLKQLQSQYTPILKEIIADDSRVSLESVKTHPQINAMQKLLTSLYAATNKINEATKIKIFPEPNEQNKLNEAKTRNLGRIAHTLSSIWERKNHIDTWAMILLVLFIDLFVPLVVYILIREKDGEKKFGWFFGGEKTPKTWDRQN